MEGTEREDDERRLAQPGPLTRTLAVRSGLVPTDEIQAYLDQRVSVGGDRLGDALRAEPDRNDYETAVLLAGSLGLSFTDLVLADPEPGVPARITRAQALQYHALPLRIRRGVPTVAVAFPSDQVLQVLTDLLGAEPQLVVAPADRLEALIDRVYRPPRRRRAADQRAADRAEAAAAGWPAHEPEGFAIAPAPPARLPHETGAPHIRREPATTGLRARAAKGVLWTAAGNWGNQITTLVIFMVLSRLLDPAAFGLVALASVFVGLTLVIANQGLVDALVQRKNLEREHLDTAFWIGLVVGLALMAVMVGLAYPLALLLGESDLTFVLMALSLTIPIGSTNLVQRALMTRELAFRSLTLRTLFATGAGSVAGVTAAVLGFGVWSLVAQNLANVITGAIALWTLTSWRPRFRFSRRHFRDLFGYGINVVAFKLLNYLGRRADDLLIGSFLGAATLGFYAVAYRMLTMVIEVTTSLIDSVAFPLYSHLQDEQERLRRAYYKTTSFVALISFPVFLMLLVMAPEVVELFFGAKWAPSVPVMRVLTLVGILQALNYLNSTMLKALGKPSWRVIIVGINTLFAVVAFFIAVRHGITAVAIALASVGYLLMPISYFAVNRLLPIGFRAYIRHIWGPLVAALALAGAAYQVRQVLEGSSPITVLAAGCTAGTIAYLVAIQVVARPLSREAYALVRNALGKGQRDGKGRPSTVLS